MPSLKDLKNRIASVKATQKITKAMKMVAAAKLRRAQEAAEAARPYSQRMSAVLSNIAQAVGSERQRAAPDDRHGRDQTHLHRGLHGRTRPLRRLQSPDRPLRARPRAQAALPTARR